MTTAAAEAIHNARLSERFRIAELAEERARELEAAHAGRHSPFGEQLADLARLQADTLRDFAAELREMS